ncbi:Pls/PosA family non-ribosomal peptide synthetase [Paucibacter sp. KCTC 42545]|uniref:Pls/PosA family non-ribosomal peptide synthetase n=1 Tax=Paucibacter sp. KCTC 42545 TaxID=1768242 RepID=UPI000733B5A7|nr:Pls/PosA family non-ribosomal peptide synthetase [Paucibacter sp. KCTC 42545]ALT78826.1 peptide synthetase [Paucibacter sp. KCTC 42545]
MTALLTSELPILRGPARPDLLRTEVLADLFEATARQLPEQIALRQGERQLSYGELDAAANRAASRLIEAGVRPGQIVGLWMPRGIELLVMQLAIAKTGAAWLPSDAETPAERVAVCLADAQAVGLLTCAEWAERDSEHKAAPGLPVWCAEDLLLPFEPALRRREGALPEHTAYVIYTSGSTGKPKGIAITQASICHFLRSENAVLGVRASDTVYQGFSVAFDMSFEEIWISYLVGATLWLAPREIAADPDALPQALIDQGVSVLHAVPTLLALFSQDVPGLRLINLGGEMCPEALVARWAKPGRQVFNTYGPTEATVSASLAELQAGAPVTIGQPLPNYQLMVIAADVENGLRLQPQGETGELCISGPGVAAGYLGRPELTAEKFLANPWAGADQQDTRLYRTGDLARIDAQGQVHCLGRVDDQVKIRGFRVELGEIEAVLAQQAGVGTVAVLLRRDEALEHLVAYLVADTATPPAAATLRQALGQTLPPYMVPSRYEWLTAMPRLTSGKIDRNTLKARPLAALAPESDSAGSDTPANAAEAALFEVLRRLFPGQALRREADFFSDLGGHSLLAARLASALRATPRFAGLTVRDIYQNRRLGAIAAVLEAMSEPSTSGPAAAPSWQPPAAWRRWRCGAAQALAVPPLVALRMASWLAPFFTFHFFTGDPNDSVLTAVLMSVAVFLAATVMEFAVALAGKWLIAGRLKPGRYPLWGLTYFRWWLADRLLENAPVYFLGGSSLYVGWLRLLGAHIGKDVMIGSITLRAPELLSVGDGASIGNAVNLENARVLHGELLLGRIDIAANAYVGSYSVLEGNTGLETWAHLQGQSALADGGRVPAQRIWGGSPARDVGAFEPTRLRPRPAVSGLRRAAEALFFLGGALLIATLFFLPVFPTFMLIDSLDELPSMSWLQGDVLWLQVLRYFILALPASAVLILFTALLSAAIRWGVLPKMRAGSWPVHSWVYCGKWLVNQIQESSLHSLHGVYATVFAPWWYRLLGAKVGRDAEISTALGVVPDMLTLGDETFIADAVLLGDEEIDGGWMSVQPTVVSRRSFVGNGAYVPDGTTIPENVLIGVLSRAPDGALMRSGDTWLGTPPINLPARETVQGCYPEALTFRPSPLRRLGRGLIETFRIVAPHAIVIATGYTIVLDVMPDASEGRWALVAWELAQAGLMFGLGCFLFVALFKWLLLGRYRPRAMPMWTPFVWISEAATNLYEGIAVPNFMRFLRGTPWLPTALRLLGAKIGRGVYLDTTDITEFDCVHIGAHSELNALTCPQTHLFEDRVMKIDHVHIGERVNIGPRSTVLYGASVGDDAQLGPMTLVMKGESIPAGSAWCGCPAGPQRA